MSESAPFTLRPEEKTAQPVLVSLDQVSKVFVETGARIELFRNLSLDIVAGDFLSIMGASGVGKSTLLHLLGFLDKPTEGRILFRGDAITEISDRKLSQIRNREIGFVFQFHHLLPDLTVWENVLLPARISGRAIQEAEARAKELLTQVGLNDRLKHLPNELSGGERQRAAVARALVNNPGVLLCDEPSGNLDAGNALALHELLQEVNRRLNVAILVVTHDASLADLARRRFILQGGALKAR